MRPNDLLRKLGEHTFEDMLHTAVANLIAIAANDGVMPASASALRRAGIGEATEFSNSTFVSDAKFQWLGDVFAVPAHWPLSNVFSVGDIIVVIGIGYLAHRQCRTSMPPRHSTTSDSAGALVP